MHKNILGHGLIYGLASFLQSAIGFAIVFILTSFYTPEEFGVFSLLLVIGSFASIIFYFGASSALGRYYFEDDSLKYNKSIISSAFQITAFGAFVLILIATIFSSNISIFSFQTDAYKIDLQLMFYAFAFTLLNNLFNLILTYDNKSTIYLLINLISLVINFCVTYVLIVYFNYKVRAPIIGLFISNILCFLFYIFYYKSYLSLDFNNQNVTNLLRFGIPTVLTSLLYFVLDFIDRFILKDLVSLSELGIYSLAYRLAMVINVVLIAPFGLIWAPLRMKNSKNVEQTKVMMVKVTSYMVMAGFMAILVVILFGRSIMPVFFHKVEFLDALYIMPILILGIFIKGLQNVLDYGINYFKKLHYYVIAATCSIFFNVVANYIFIPTFGYMAAAYVTTLTYLINTLLIFRFSMVFFKVRLELARIFAPLLVLLCFLFLFKFNANFFDSVWSGVLILLITTLLFFRYWLHLSEKLVIVKLFAQLYNHSKLFLKR
jgi:O-antigen/teichoic acid export membrane protein